MHHPGPPRFVATGDTVELAPRDPDPAATYAWRLARAPADSAVTLGENAVESFTPNAPGRYLAVLSAPDGEHSLTIRAFPGSLSPRTQTGASGPEVHRTGPEDTQSVERTETETGESGGAETESGENSGGGRPRITLSATADSGDVVVHADPRPNPRGGERPSDLGVEFIVDDRDDVDRQTLQHVDRDLVIPLDQVTERVRVYAVAVGNSGYSVPDAIEIAVTGDEVTADGGIEARAESTPAALTRGIRTSKPFEPPEWTEGAVIYEIYVRTFGDGEGTAFDDIVDRLDYVASLGVDVVWLTPVLENDHAPHGYNVTDFFAIAEDLGTRADYLRFVEAAHDHDIKVLFDLVLNHSARAHPYFQSAVSGAESEYREWYEWRTDTEPETYFDWEHIANFDFSHLPVRRYLLDAVDEWAPLVDGFRCDMAWAVPNSFWREVHDRVKGRDPEFLLLDETIPYIPDFQAGLFDVHFDSTTYAALRRVGHGEAPATDLLDAVEERTEIGFPDYAGFMLYAENHDETRYLVECGRPAAEAALGALFTLPGAPMVYAGQEFGQRGKRDDLAWAHADDSFREFVESLATARHEERALAADASLERIDYDVLDGDAERVVAYARLPPADAPSVVVLNFGSEPAVLGLDGAVDETDVVTGESLTDERGLVVDSVAVFPAAPAALID